MHKSDNQPFIRLKSCFSPYFYLMSFSEWPSMSQVCYLNKVILLPRMEVKIAFIPAADCRKSAINLLLSNKSFFENFQVCMHLSKLPYHHYCHCSTLNTRPSRTDRCLILWITNSCRNSRHPRWTENRPTAARMNGVEAKVHILKSFWFGRRWQYRHYRPWFAAISLIVFGPQRRRDETSTLLKNAGHFLILPCHVSNWTSHDSFQSEVWSKLGDLR